MPFDPAAAPAYVAIAPGQAVFLTDDGYAAMVWAHAHAGVAHRVRDGLCVFPGARGAPAGTESVPPGPPTLPAPPPAPAAPSEATYTRKNVTVPDLALRLARENGSVTAADLVARGVSSASSGSMLAAMALDGRLVRRERGVYALPL